MSVDTLSKIFVGVEHGFLREGGVTGGLGCVPLY